MAITFVQGLAGVGDGKSYVLVNKIIRDFLRHTGKHVYTTCPVDGKELGAFLAYCFPGGQYPRRDEARKRLHLLYPGLAEFFHEFWERPVPLAELNALQAEAADGRHEPVVIGEMEDTVGWVRVAWPTNDETVRLYKDEGYRYRRVFGGKSDRVARFWDHVPAGAVVVIDEVADIFGSDEMALKGKDDAVDPKRKRAEFGQFLRQHRHYKFDLYFCAQDAADIDIKVRRLIERSLFCRNLKKTPFIDHWSMRGLRWPIQAFEVREHLNIHTVGKSGEQILRQVPVDSYRIFPLFDGGFLKNRGFQNYRSFSAAATLSGKALAGDEVRSGDLDTPWDRIKGVLGGLWKPLAVAGFIGVGIVCGLDLVYAMAGADSGKVGHFLYGAAYASKTNSVGSVKIPNTQTNEIHQLALAEVIARQTAKAATTNSAAGNPPSPEKKDCFAILVSPDFIRLSDGRVLRRGDEWPGRGVISGWDQRGAGFGGFLDQRTPWAVLFSGGGRAGK